MPDLITLPEALRMLVDDVTPVAESAVARLRASVAVAQSARQARRAAWPLRIAAGILMLLAAGALPLPRETGGAWAMGLVGCPGRLVSAAPSLTGLGCLSDALHTALAAFQESSPDLARIPRGPRAYTMITRVDGMAGYDASERWLGVTGGRKSGEVVVSLSQRGVYACCMSASIVTNGSNATLAAPRTAIRATDAQALLMMLLIEGLPLADGWQGRLAVPAIRSATGSDKPVAFAKQTFVSVRVAGRTSIRGVPAWRVLAGRSTLFVDTRTRQTVGIDEPTHLAGHLREIRLKSGL